MRKLIYKSIVFSTILCGSFYLGHNILPYYYGNRLFTKKLSTFEQNHDSYNSLLFGSSRIYQGVDSKQLSLLTNDTLSFYNFAAPGCINPQSYYLYEHFIDSYDSGIFKMAVIEITSVLYDFEEAPFAHGNYWCDFENLAYLFDFMIEEGQGFQYFDDFIVLFVNRLFSVKRFMLTPSSIKLKNEIGNDGFYTLDVKQNLMNQDSIAEIVSRTSKTASRFDEYIYLTSNRVHLERLTELNRKSLKKGINLIFLITPRGGIGNDYQKLVSFTKYDELNIIDLAYFQKFPDLYELENGFDAVHFNSQGARLFTNKLADKLNESTY